MKNKEWWKDAVVYQIYPRSFQDSNQDGIGDINGIIQRLDYIKYLGADVIWLCPIYASPNADNGYDISDYRSIHPDFGTMEDFDRLLSQAHQKGIRIIMDLVVNHTSDEHAWFQLSRSSRDNPFRDYYIWRDVKPNNWCSWFSGPAWEYDSQTDSHYLHIFARKQPDLNWANPRVRSEVYDMMCWWLNKGVDGFRMDVISLISKPEVFPQTDNPDLSPYCVNGPHVHEYLKEMHTRVLSHYDIMTVGECPNVTVADALQYSGKDTGELNMVFQFDHTTLTDGKYGKWTDGKTSLPKLKQVFDRWQRGLKDRAWNCLFWGNHDQPRAVSKFGCDLPEFRDVSAKMLCLCLYLMQGTPYLYQGEELGMTNAGFFDLSQYRDIESINAYHDFVDSSTLNQRTMLNYLSHVSRDNARTPMQWDSGPYAGFSSHTPWINLGRNWRAVNAARQLDDPNSVFSFYKHVLEYRKGNPLIQNGSFELLWPDHEQIFGYARKLKEETLLILCNFSAKSVTLPDTPYDPSSKIELSNYSDASCRTTLRPYEAMAVYSK